MMRRTVAMRLIATVLLLGALCQVARIEAQPGTTIVLGPNDEGMTVSILHEGCSIYRMLVPDKNGSLVDVVLGYETIDDYMTNVPWTNFGAIVGRVANRIANASFSLEGATYNLDKNDGNNTLHGGVGGLSRRIWRTQGLDPVRTAAYDTITMYYDSPCDEEGFPGTVTFAATFTLMRAVNELHLKLHTTTTSVPTPINLASHPYFNLAGHASGTNILGTRVVIPSGTHYTPVNSELIPTGEIATVVGTGYDFLEPHTFGERIEQVGGYDINYALWGFGTDARLLSLYNGQAWCKPKVAATACDPCSGRCLSISTTVPGLQVYTGGGLTPMIGKDGAAYDKYSGFAFESQGFPNAVNQPNFPTTIITPEEPYQQHIIYSFFNM